MQVNNPLPVPTFDVETAPVSVYNAIAPAAFTDLDLSSVVGVRHAKVMLLWQNNTGAAAHFTCRRNGGQQAVGLNAITSVGNGLYGLVEVDTDIAGIIEWYSVAAGTCQIWIMNWITEP